MAIDKSVADEQWRRYVYLRDNGHLDFVEKANKCDKYYLGDQWDPIDKALLEHVRRPALTINKILPTIANLQGDYVNTRVDVGLKNKRSTGVDNAQVLEYVLKHIFDANQYRWQEAQMYDDGIITSRGFIDTRLTFKENMQGEAEITCPNPRNIVIDCDAEEYDPDTWNDVLYTKWLSPVDIAVLYNQEDADYLRLATPTDYQHEFDAVYRQIETFKSTPHYQGYVETDRELMRNIRVIERQFRMLTKQKFFVDPTTGEMRAIPDAWDRNKISYVVSTYGLSVVENFVKRIRWRVTAGPCVLHDAWSPYRYFTITPFFPYFRRGKTMGVVENLTGSQELLNKVTSQELHVVNTTANSGWKVKTGGLRNMSISELEQRGAQTGIVLELDDMGSAEKIEPNQVPTGLDRISYKAEEHIKSISTVNDTALGDDREDVAAKAIREKKRSQSINTLKMQDNLNRTRWLVARNLIDIIQTYYQEPRVFRITKDEILGETEDLEVNQIDQATGQILNDLTVGEYDIVITTTPQKDTVAESEFEQALAMKELGIQIPDQILIENSNLRSKQKLLRQMKEQQQSPEAQKEAELMAKAKELAVEQQEADIDETHADILLKTANAERNKAEAAVAGMEGGGTPEDPGLEREKMAHESSENEQDRQLKREEMAHQSGLQAQKAQTDVAVKREEAAIGQMERTQEFGMQRASQAEDRKHQKEMAQQTHKQKLVETKTAAKVRPKPQPKKGPK
jgi:hypothetical protein